MIKNIKLNGNEINAKGIFTVEEVTTYKIQSNEIANIDGYGFYMNSWENSDETETDKSIIENNYIHHNYIGFLLI